MYPLRNVLCATDLSEAAGEALRQAASIASTTGARLVVLHVVPFPTLIGEAPLPTIDRNALVGPAREQLDRHLASASVPTSTAREVTVETRGIFADILDKAESMRADLVVVGSHRYSALKRVLLGSTADKLVRQSHHPVLVARPAAAAGKVVVATDLGDPSQALVRLAEAEARRRGATLTVAHCLELAPEVVGLGIAPMVPATPDFPNSRAALRHAAQERVIEFLTRAKVDGEIVIQEGLPGREIVALAEQLPAELVVVGITRKAGLKRLVPGSIAETVLHKAPASVLAVPL